MNITCITGGEMSDTTGNKQQLLIVDDSKVIRVTARKILRDHFETVEAVDGENAWEILNSAPPFSVVVTDLTMPNLDGYGLLERIRITSYNVCYTKLLREHKAICASMYDVRLL